MASFRIPRWVRRTLIWLGSLVAFIALLASGVWLYLHPTVERIDGIVYGQRGARPLTLDILRPTHPNGLGIALMVSGKNREKPGHPRESVGENRHGVRDGVKIDGRQRGLVFSFELSPKPWPDGS